jgi:hypothetical protein
MIHSGYFLVTAIPGSLEIIMKIALVTGFVAIMAFETGVSGIVDRMAIGAGSMLMVGTISIATTGMVERSIPITGAMALRTVSAKSGMVFRCGVT